VDYLLDKMDRAAAAGRRLAQRTRDAA